MSKKPDEMVPQNNDLGVPCAESLSGGKQSGVPETEETLLLSCRAWHEWIGELSELSRRRAPAERRIPAVAALKTEAAHKRYERLRTALVQRYEADKSALEAAYTAQREQSEAEFQAEYARIEREYEKKRRTLVEQAAQKTDALRRDLREAQWEVQTIYDATKDKPLLELRATTARIDALWKQIQSFHQQAVTKLQSRWLWSKRFSQTSSQTAPRQETSAGGEHAGDGPNQETAPGGPGADASAGVVKSTPSAGTGSSPRQSGPEEPIRRLTELVEKVQQCVAQLDRFSAGTMLQGETPILLVLAGMVVAAIAGAGLAGWGSWTGWAMGAAAGAAGIGCLLGLYYPRARTRALDSYQALRSLLQQAELVRSQALEAAQKHCHQTQTAMREHLQAELHGLEQTGRHELDLFQSQHQAELQNLDTAYPARLQKLQSDHQQHLAQLEADFHQRSQELDETFQKESRDLEARYQRYLAAVESRRKRRWENLCRRWHQTIEQFSHRTRSAHQQADVLCPSWTETDWTRWQPPTAMPSGIRFGEFELRLDQLPGGLPQHPDLEASPTSWRTPALVPFPDWPLLLLRVCEEGRQQAVELLQTIVLRLLTSLPPAKVRLTIIDPVGLGENFSAFMHLADYDEKLVTSRIWTEPAHIESRLADLTEHMETVLQVYLRNEFETIVQYNAFAGELAEPYRVLVVANFPVGFQENSAARLRSIVASGARCGVFTLMSVDDRLRLPRDFHMSDLEPYAWSLHWSEDRFVWDHPAVGPLSLRYEPPPPPELFTQIVRQVGQAVQEVGKVEVPFASGAPATEQWWTVSSQDGLEVPLGRAGAKKFQFLHLGEGTSQHVLTAGKTGSGKSTLWHVLITQTALRYSPDEVEMYLVDFKKGVEFKAYAAAGLPHARVIAIESEREFGLSVLERLDAELHQRGDLFRQHGVQDLPGFRAANPEVRLPRILLVIDEFQELFVEDDRIAQAAALLLDRLVRQGRAFGIHVLLGSQTLAGAYSLPRSTLGQMAVRIALQCSEADAHLILSEENTAARLLTRPGEAIYNDANGLYEGNHPFQVFWLSDAEREKYLARLRDFASHRQYRAPRPIVFEGNVPARLEENLELRKWLESAHWPKPPRTPRIWLGDAVSIKPPTQAIFTRQSASNVLMVGHRDDLARGLFASALVSLAAQYPPEDPTGSPAVEFYLLDGTRPDATEAEYFRELASVLPLRVHRVEPAQAGPTIGRIAEELARRQSANLEQAPPLYLMIYDLSRFRSLRRAEEEFGFSFGSEDRPASPAQQFAQILREGPVWGIHSLLWCDSYHTFTRWLDRHALPDFEMRVLFALNASDSSNLIDSTMAATLGMHRAVLYLEGSGDLEKFRPYAPPSKDFLQWAAQQLSRRTPEPNS